MRSCFTISSEPLEEPDVAFRGGDPELFGIFDGRHCVAWEGTVTIVLVAFWFCNAILRRLARLAFWDSCVEDVIVVVIFYDI